MRKTLIFFRRKKNGRGRADAERTEAESGGRGPLAPLARSLALSPACTLSEFVIYERRRRRSEELPLSLPPSLPPSLVRIATVLDRTIHPYKRRIWFWIGAAAAHTGRATETQKQLHRQETDGSHSLADQISLFSLSPISSDGNTKWGGGGVSTSRTLTRPPTTTTTTRKEEGQKR